MDNFQVLGIVVSAVITLGGFVAVIMKFVQPINELNIVIQRLDDTIKNLQENNDVQNRRIGKHGEQIDKLDKRVSKIEVKMDSLHKD